MFFYTGLHSAAYNSFIQPRLALKSKQSSCLSFPMAGTGDVHYHAQLDIPLLICTQRKFRPKNLTCLQNVDETLGKYELV